MYLERQIDKLLPSFIQWCYVILYAHQSCRVLKKIEWPQCEDRHTAIFVYWQLKYQQLNREEGAQSITFIFVLCTMQYDGMLTKNCA